MKQNKKSVIIRQGDVLLIPVDKIPEGMKTTKKVTLALGESTGHHHTIYDGAVGYADDEDSLVEYLSVTNQVGALTHQEHDTIAVPNGNYLNVSQFQYTPEKLERVAD
jgi:hypothetical protein